MMYKCLKCFLYRYGFIWLLVCLVFAAPSISLASCSEEKILLNYKYVGVCGYTQSTSFTLTEETYITRIRIWYDTGVGGNSLSATLSGPNGYSSVSGNLPNGGCQGNWCEAIWSLNQALKVGTYTLTASSKSVCSNPSGQTTLILYGCATPTPTPIPTPTPTPTPCTATINENLLLHIPYLYYGSGALSLWADFVYEFNPTYPSFILFKLNNAGIINNPSFSCAASTISDDLKIHIPNVMLPDGSTRLWVDLEYDSTLSHDGSHYFRLANYGDISNFQYGTPRTFNVSAAADTSIQDSLSGNTFRFPQGGYGTLTITPITSTPETGPAAGSGFRVEYSGTEPLQMLIPYKADEVPLLWLWGDPAVSIYESIAPAQTWLPVLSQDITLNPALFNLSFSGDSANAVAVHMLDAAPTRNPDMKIWQSNLDSKSTPLTKMELLLGLTTVAIQKVIDLLPAEVQTKALAEINGRLRPSLKPYTFAAISSYHPFSLLTGAVDPYFIFVAYNAVYGTLATVSTVAHEVGHYMSHVLLGDDKMRLLTKQANRNHNFGDPHAGRPMLEEYAMFSDYCINDSVVGGDITSTWDMIGNNRTPAEQDWPSKEGYATSLLALMHTDTSKLISSRSGESEYIPLIHASQMDLWGILAKGPMTVNDLRSEIEAYLTTRGKKDMLSPLLERTGWSYHGNGQVVDEKKNAKPSVVVQAVAKVPSEGAKTEYLAPLEPVTADKDGKFTLDRIFPGANFIRVWPSAGAKDFVDFPITVDPALPTNDSLVLGEFVYPEEKPVISSVTPPSARMFIGSTSKVMIHVNGSGFGYPQGTGTVSFNGIVAEVSFWNDKEIWAYVPQNATSGDLIATVNGVDSNAVYFPIETVIDRIKQSEDMFVWFSAMNTYSNKQSYMGGTSGSNGYNKTVPINWSGNSFSYSFVQSGGVNTTYTRSANGTVSPDGKTILSLTFTDQQVTVSASTSSEIVSHLTIVNLPISLDSDSGADYKVTGSGVQKYVASFDSTQTFTSASKVTVVSYESTDWSNSKNLIQVIFHLNALYK